MNIAGVCRCSIIIPALQEHYDLSPRFSVVSEKSSVYNTAEYIDITASGTTG